ncbi:MAG: hypothetical protein EA384_15850 [Spirochaetaceae bacterium]|nr:MAG: hypothetical protein EA384_15850 [Spirochaetaceae bacterium]
MKCRLSRWVVAAFLLCATLAVRAPQLEAQRFRNSAYDYYLDIPIGWTVLHAESAEEVTFTDSERKAVFQVLAFENRFDSIERLGRFVRERFDAYGDSAGFTYNGYDSLLADYRFSAGRNELRGYFLLVHAGRRSYVVMGYAALARYEQYHDVLLSAMDSFAPGSAARHLPGPVSQFYYPYPAPDPKTVTVTIDGARLQLPLDDGELEATQVLIEREARLLTAYGRHAYRRPDPRNLPPWAVAWQRYYRAIYRDNFARLAPLARQLDQHFSATAVPAGRIPRELLAWLQGFEYYQTGSLSRLLSPPLTLVTRSGDCDSLGLTYVILLHHLGFDAILLVSSEYAHAVAGVDVAGDGWRYRFEGRSYLAAELTADAELGLIDSTLADPGGWIPVGFRDPPLP